MLSWIDQEGGLTDPSLQPAPSDQHLHFVWSGTGPCDTGFGGWGESGTGRRDGTKLLQKNWSMVRIWLQFQQKISVIASLTGPGVG